MKVKRDIALGATPDAVYDLVMDPHRLGDWVSVQEELKEAPNGILREGSKLVQSLKVAGQRFDVRWTVVTAERPSRVVWHGEGPARTKARVAYDLSPQDGGTRFTYLNEYELPGGPLGRVAGRAVAGRAGREAERTLERLKALLEG